MNQHSASLNRTRYILTGISVSALARTLTLAAPFVTMPWMFDYLGPRSFGIWTTTTSLTTASAFLDFGLGSALLTRLASAFGRDARNEARDAISSGYAALNIIALALLLIGTAVYAALALAPTSITKALMPGDIAIIGSTLVGFIIGIPISIVYRIYFARQQVAVAHYWQILGAGLSVMITYVTIRLEAQIWQVALAYALTPILVSLLATVLLFLREPDIRPCYAAVSVPVISDLLSLGLRFLTLAICTSIFLNIDPIIVAWKAGPEAVVNFAVPAKIGSLLMLVVTTVFVPLWPANGEAIARRDHAWLRQSTRRMSLYGGLLVALLAVALVWCGDWLICMWMRHTYDQQKEVLAAVAVFATLMAIASPHMMVLNALGKVGPQIVAFALFGTVSVPLKLWLVQPCQIWWAPLISAVLYALIVLPMAIAAARDGVASQ